MTTPQQDQKTPEEKKEQIAATMELKQLAFAVQDLLVDQKKFFKTRDNKLLEKCKEQERHILQWCDRIIHPDTQTKLF